MTLKYIFLLLQLFVTVFDSSPFLVRRRFQLAAVIDLPSFLFCPRLRFAFSVKSQRTLFKNIYERGSEGGFGKVEV